MNPSAEWRDIAFDGDGNLYVAAGTQILKRTPQGAVSSLAGVPSSTTGSAGAFDGTGPNARFNLAWSLDIDAAGNVLVVDRFNSAIRKVSPTGQVTTLAGQMGQSGRVDGTGAAARFAAPQAIAITPSGDAIVAETSGAGVELLRSVTAGGEVLTLAGRTPTQTAPGDGDGVGGNAWFNLIWDIAVDGFGNVYVAEFHRIRRMDAQLLVTTLAGAGTFFNGFSDGLGSIARFDNPRGVSVNAAGDTLYISDHRNCLLRRVR